MCCNVAWTVGRGVKNKSLRFVCPAVVFYGLGLPRDGNTKQNKQNKKINFSEAELDFKILKMHGRSKNQNLKFKSNGAYYMQNDERIPNMALEFKSDNI